jgi:inhibitor of cysteine peptidase
MAALAGGAWVCVPVVLGVAEAGKAATMISLGEKDDGRTVEVHAGDTVEVSLPENASAGYRWAVDRLDADAVRQLSATPHNSAKAIGAPGTIAFTFEATKAGTAEIALKSWRSWEGDASVVRRFQVRLSVKP